MVGAQRFALSRAAIAAVTLATAALVAGCADVPAVARGPLAHATMTANDTFTSALAAHVNTVSEGPGGGLNGGGGGCGCN